MVLKDIKAVLKEARAAINNKDYNSSVKLCKSILKEDKENYMALILLGVSLQEVGPLEQVPLVFRKAIQLDSSNILAWNGLRNYYEKTNSLEAKTALVDVYCTLLKIESNKNKIEEYCEKLVEICSEAMQVNICRKLYKLTEDIEENIISYLWISIVSILFKFNKFSPELINIFEEALNFLTNNKKTVTRQYYSEYLKVLQKQNKRDILLQEAEKMYLLYSDSTIALEWICKIYNESYIERTDLTVKIENKINVYYEKLLEIQPDSIMALFTKSIMFFRDNRVAESESLLRKVTTSRPGLLHAWILLSDCYNKLHIYNESINSASKAKKLILQTNVNKTLERYLDVLYAEALSYSHDSDNLEEAVKISENLLQDTECQVTIVCSLIRAQANLGNFDEAEKNISKLKECSDTSNLPQLFTVKLLHKQHKLQEALQLLETCSNCDASEWWIEMGDLFWDLQLFDKSLVPYLKAAKLEPSYYLCFIRLGRYYEKMENFDKARRCYEKAFKLYDKHDETAIKLSEMYRKQQNWEANVVLLQHFAADRITSDNLWAFLQLGLNYLEQEDYDKAIENLQIVVRFNPLNNYCWESLADAYMSRGSYTSALKCYQKSIEIFPNSLYSLLQVAVLKKILNLYAEARTDFEVILSRHETFVPALKGCAETCILHAQYYRREQMTGLARDSAQYALDKLTDALKIRSDLSCLWKLLGDACVFIARLPKKYCCALVLRSLADGKPAEDNKILEEHELYTLAARCYCKALNLIEDNVMVWHDLGSCYFSHARATTDSEKAHQLFELALSATKHCTTVNPTGWQHWNLLGNIYCFREPKNYSLAQHAFIKAVSIDHNSAISWSNLGTLYLVVDNIKLANTAFSQAQRADPNYMNSWIGQALVAESVGDRDAMDLFRHSMQLGAHQESGIGYGHWLCQTLLEISSAEKTGSVNTRQAVAVACDALTWYTENDPESSCAWNMLGILKERMGLNLSASQAFRSAFRLTDSKLRDAARMNFARLLTKTDNYSQAIEMYKDVNSATFNSGSGLALALFKNQQYEESYEAYESALHWLTEEQGLQSDLLVALASMAYMFQGPDAAKTLLFQSIQLKPPSPWGLYATLALGLLHGDIKLAELVLKESENLKDNPQCLPHYAVLISYTHILQERFSTAIIELSKLVHRHPNQASTWLTLGILLLNLHEVRKPSPAISKCVEAAVKLGQSSMDVTKVLCLVSLSSVLMGDYKEAIKNAQKAIHCYPNVSETWTVLISSLVLMRTTSKQSREKLDLQLLINFVIDDLNPSTTIVEWLNKQKNNL